MSRFAYCYLNHHEMRIRLAAKTILDSLILLTSRSLCVYRANADPRAPRQGPQKAAEVILSQQIAAD